MNISRKGLKELAKQINKMNFVQIIYIGCCDESVERDIRNLDRYEVKDNYKLDYVYVINFIMK